MNPIRTLLVILLSGAFLTASTIYKSSESMVVSKNDTIKGDLFYGGRYLEIAGNSSDDVFSGTQKTLVSGLISDDFFASGEEIRLEGEVGDMFLGFGKDIIIKGTVQGDVIAYGGSVQILEGAQILGNLYVGTGYLNIDRAHIAGTVNGGAGKIILNGTFDKSINLSAANIRFGDQFSAKDKVKLSLNKAPEQPLENAPADLEIKVEPIKHFFTNFTFYWFLLSGLVIGFILLAIMPGLFEKLPVLGLNKFPAIAGSGALFFVLTPVAAIFAIIFLPLTFILTALFLILVYLSKIFTAYIVSDYMLKKIWPDKQLNRYLIFFVGYIMLSLLFKIPYLGFWGWLASVIIGSGAIVYQLVHLRKNGTSITA